MRPLRVHFRLLPLALALSLGSPPPASAFDPAAAAAYSSSHGGTALIIARNGRILTESHAAGHGPHRPAPIYSITKSLCALGILAAAHEGLLHLEDEARPGATIQSLLQQTSGVDPGYARLYGRTLRDKSAAARNLPLTSPGRFVYGPSHYELLAAHLTRRLGCGPRAPGDYVRSRILAPLGAADAPWRRDPLGSPFFSAGMQATPRQLLAAGRLIERGGWSGIRRILPRHLLATALTGSESNPAYGMGFWLNTNANQPNAHEQDIERALALNGSSLAWTHFCLSRSAPPDLIAMAGSRGQRVYVSPSRHIVIVRLGTSTSFSDPAFLSALFR